MDLILDIRSQQLNLLLAPREIARKLTAACTARLALAGPVLVLDGGNCFAARQIASLLRRQTSRLETTLQRIYVARAFTCYQMVAMLAETSTDQKPTLVLELLATFQDENVALPERQRLFQHSLVQLRRLSRQSAVLVTARISAKEGGGGGGDFVQELTNTADKIWCFEAPTAPALQATLWPESSFPKG